MSDYVFGREVTVKLPEPSPGRDEWFIDERLDRWTVDADPRFPRVGLTTTRGEPWWAYFEPWLARKIGAALLAAADYAEGGEA